MKRLHPIAALFFVIPILASGQNAAPTAEIFVGGSTLWETTPLRYRFSNPGFDLAFTYKLDRFVGLETHVSAFKNATPGAPVYVDRFRLLLGPHVAHNANSRVSLFAHALGGLTRGQECTSDCFLGRYPPGPLAGAQADGNAFTVALGGGVDVHIFRNFWFRPVQADYVRVFRPFDASIFPESTPENDLQLAFGFTFRFGNRRKSRGH